MRFRMREEDIYQQPDPDSIEEDEVLQALEEEMNLLVPFVDGRRKMELKANKDAWREGLVCHSQLLIFPT